MVSSHPGIVYVCHVMSVQPLDHCNSACVQGHVITYWVKTANMHIKLLYFGGNFEIEQDTKLMYIKTLRQDTKLMYIKLVKG